MILLIEDEEILRFSFGTFLEDAGYQVETTAGCIPGAEILSSKPVDLVICDIVLPDGSGMDILQQVHTENPQCPVIMITGQPALDTATEAVRLGAYDYLVKPVNKDTLLRTTAKALQFRQALVEKTEANQAKESLSRDLEAIFSSVQEGIITVDQQTRILKMNPAAQKICNCDTDELLGQRLDEASFSCSRACLKDIQKVLSDGTRIAPHQVECRQIDRPDKVVMLTSTPLLEGDEAQGCVLVVRDITKEQESIRDVRQAYGRIVGAAPPMQELYRLLDDLSGSDATVLIVGESGTGKELVAEALHLGGKRADKPFIKVNCSSLSETLLESELFGHTRGAFTGAIRDKIGRFEAAQGGTILLDEIGDISRSLQLKLLRVLQEKVIERVGDSRPIPIDVRILTATNKDLKKLLQTNRFRQDLYYRLNVISVEVPALRDRQEDIPLLLEHFRQKFNQETRREIQGYSDEVKSLLSSYPWPGNIRELEHIVEHGFVRCHDSTITVALLPPEIRAWQDKTPSELGAGSDSTSQETILKTIEACAGNKALAARKLGISRRTIYRKLEQIDPETP